MHPRTAKSVPEVDGPWSGVAQILAVEAVGLRMPPSPVFLVAMLGAETSDRPAAFRHRAPYSNDDRELRGPSHLAPPRVSVVRLNRRVLYVAAGVLVIAAVAGLVALRAQVRDSTGRSIHLGRRSSRPAPASSGSTRSRTGSRAFRRPSPPARPRRRLHPALAVGAPSGLPIPASIVPAAALAAARPRRPPAAGAAGDVDAG
jgi:hypothetical protein